MSSITQNLFYSPIWNNSTGILIDLEASVQPEGKKGTSDLKSEITVK